MTSLCMDCHAEISERCAKCGLPAQLIGKDLFKCLSCRVTWVKGYDSRASHGLCHSCLSQRQEKTKSAAPEIH